MGTLTVRARAGSLRSDDHSGKISVNLGDLDICSMAAEVLRPDSLSMELDVLIADSHRLTLDGMRVAIERTGDLRVVDAVASAADLLAALKRHAPHVVLVDADLPDMDGERCVGLIRQNHPGVKVGVTLADRDVPRIQRVLAAGAAACIMKSVDPAHLPMAVSQIVEATLFTASGCAPAPAAEESPRGVADLTAREVTMLRAIARGLSNKAIGRELWVTEQTVKFHLNNVYRKLGVPNRTAAARFAYEHGIVADALGPAVATAV
jgi:DNA-binding NarL/FixJ family response regulator